MALILIHPDYQAGSARCPVCNARRGEVRVHSLTLCYECGTTAIGRNPRQEMTRRHKARYWNRILLPVIYGITVVLFDIGYAIHHILGAFRNTSDEQKQHRPVHANHNLRPRHEHAKLHKCTI